MVADREATIRIRPPLGRGSATGYCQSHGLGAIIQKRNYLMIYNVGSLYLAKKEDIEKVRFVPRFLLKKAPDTIPLTFLYSEFKHHKQINVFCIGFASSRLIKLSEKTCQAIKLTYVKDT